jgi:MFS family permease
MLETMRRMAGNVRLMGVLLSRMSTMFIMVPLMAFLPLLMTDFMDASGTQIGIVIAGRTLVNAILQIPFGTLVDRMDKTTTLVTGSLIVVAATSVIPFVESFPGLIAVFVVIGSGEALVWPTLGALATEEGREYGHGAMMGVFNMAMSAGILFGSLTGGVAVDTLGLKYTFPIIAAILAGATFVSAAMIRSPSRAAARAVPAGSKS